MYSFVKAYPAYILKIQYYGWIDMNAFGRPYTKDIRMAFRNSLTAAAESPGASPSHLQTLKPDIANKNGEKSSRAGVRCISTLVSFVS